ncbi:unnamed protein product [Urochloa humidicola]
MMSTMATGDSTPGFPPCCLFLKSDGSLCIMRLSIEASKSITLEDFLGVGPAMELSLDNSSFYYGGVDDHGHDQDQAA